jgi:signal transduction histidine kinase
VHTTREIPQGLVANEGARASSPRHRSFARVIGWISWLRASRGLVVSLTVALIAASLVLDLAIPGYAIAGFYLVPILLAAFALPGRYAAIVGLLALALTILVMILQDRLDTQNILLVWFAIVAAAGLFALAYLYDRFDQLYESERRTTSRLHVLTSQLRALLEAAVLEPAPCQGALLERIADLARHLLGNDTCDLYLFKRDSAALHLEASAGVVTCDPAGGDSDGSPSAAAGAVSRRAAFLDGPWLAVPLFVRDHVCGALVLRDRDDRTYHDEDVGIAQTFADQAALAIENARLREDVERAAAGAERIRLARELHDSVTQSLFAASLEADVAAELCIAETPRATEVLDELRRLTRGALAEMRTMLLEMRPDGIARAPLAELLRHLVEAAQTRSRVAVSLTIDDRSSLPEDVHLVFYRVTQEALNNIVKHAEASSVRISLAGGEDGTELTVGDDGHGFDPHAVPRDHLGIITMRERAEGVGARLDVASKTGRGTVVTLTWPAAKGRSADG